MTPDESHARPRPRETSPASGGSASGLLAVLVDADAARARAFGLTASERLERGLARAGVVHVARDRDGVVPSPSDDRVLLVRADTFYDERLLHALAAAPAGTLLAGDDGRPLAVVAGPDRAAAARDALAGGARAGFATLAPGDLVPAYDERLRKHQPPFALPAVDSNVRGVENEIFAASYKGVTDLVTKWVWPVPARAAVRACVRRGITPNTVTAVSYALAIAVIALWAGGGRGFAPGLALAWIMTFLDTVDGKLARCTLTSSRFGHVLDHGLDLVHPPLWWAAWAWGLAQGEPGFGAQLATVWIVVGGYVVGRLLEGVFLLLFEMEMFTWRPFDGWFRQVIARRNPNLLLLSAGLAFASPQAGLRAIALWTLGSIAIQLVRIAQALALRARGTRIRPWYEEGASVATAAR
ncbi:MAG: CDP-alcohol phosphatidyltransferase family protein [Myxococcota bacterium]